MVYLPPSSVVAVCFNPVEELVALTAAPGTDEPLWSLTVPFSVAFAVCPQAEPVIARQVIARQTIVKRNAVAEFALQRTLISLSFIRLHSLVSIWSPADDP